MEKIIIAAVARNFVIGKDGKMPWHISEELKHFKKTTMNFPLLMGRKTFFSFGNGKPLKGRLNCVLTRDSSLKSEYENLIYFSSLDDIYKYCEQNGFDKLFIIGGSEIYNNTINDCDRMVLSFLRNEYDGDTYFPQIEKKMWVLDAIEEHDEFDVHYYERKLG